MRVSVGCSCWNVESRHSTLKYSKVERQTNVYKKQILQESLSRSFLVIIFTHLETPSLLMVFTLIVPLSVMMWEYPNVLHLFLTSKRNFLVSKESDSFINIEFSLLNHWHSLYTISEQFSSCATGIPEISSISLLPYCSSWFFLTFSISNSSWRSFSVLLIRVFSFFRFLFSARIFAIWLPWVSSVSAWIWFL